MQNAWQVIDCSNLVGQLKYVRGRLRVQNFDADEERQITDLPLSSIAIVLIGLRCNCSAALLHQLAEYGVSVLLCDWRGVPIAGLYSWANPATRATSRQRAQADMSLPRKKSVWQSIVKSKIRGQAAALDYLQLDGGDSLRELAKTVRSGDPTNVEGRAARLYWHCLFSATESFRRLPGSGEGRNALLDYGYMILRGFSIKAIISAGLHPAFGVNHHNGANYFCLADDLIEVFRPCVDVTVAMLPPDTAVNDKMIKQRLIESVNRQFNGSGLTIPSEMNDFSQQFALYVENKVKRLEVPQYQRD